MAVAHGELTRVGRPCLIAARSDSALEILRQRYARGEINKEEFNVKKRDLT